MKIVVAADHAGYELKATVRDHLVALGHEVLDLGTSGAASVDYPDFAHRLARMVAGGEADRGILVCGTGIGMCMAANKHDGVRAACTRDLFDTRLAREHNDANVLCLGARVLGSALAVAITEAFLDTPFAGGRHAGRVQKIARISEAR